MSSPTDDEVIDHVIHGTADAETAERVDELVQSLIGHDE